MSEIYTEVPAHRTHRTAEADAGSSPRRPRRVETEANGAIGFSALLLEILPEGVRPVESAGSLRHQNNVEDTRSGETGVDTPAGLQSPPNIEGPDSDLSKLDLEFRARLGRVMQRMEREHGHRVQVVEALRPQARQDFLYEQGRSRPGPVVTWTRASKHTLGLAADVLVDGTYENPEGYARLARIAQEEGLRTLGPNDPGHLELVADQSAVGGGHQGRNGVHASRGARLDSGGRTASIALVSIAEVAEVAEVARVATVAATAVRSVLARQSTSSEVLARAQEQLDGDAGGGEESRYGAESSGEAGAVATPSSLDIAGGTGPGLFADRLRLITGAGSVERAARLLEIREAAGLRNSSQVVLRLDDAEGDPIRIRVGLRGNVVDASIGLSNEAAVEKMRAELGDLVRALSRRGLDTEGLQVQLARSVAEIQELVEASTTRTPASPGADKDGGSERERPDSGPMADDSRDRGARDNRDPGSFHDQERKGRS